MGSRLGRWLPVLGAVLLGLLTGCHMPASAEKETREAAEPAAGRYSGPAVARAADPREKHLKNIRQLTFGGENAEAYFSPDASRIIFQSTRPPYHCDQIFTMSASGGEPQLVSTGKGRTTCSYFSYPDASRIIYSSTHLESPDCPPTPDRSKGYVWPIYPYDIFSAAPDGTDLKQITHDSAYDAEATYDPNGGRIVFTSTRDGDLDLYSMKPDGSEVRRLTNTPGYDGGAYYSWNGSMIVYRGHHPEGKELEEYRALLAENLVRPMHLEIFVMNADGSGQRQVTHNGAANFCPFFVPGDKQIIFASNMGDPEGREFDLYMIGVDGKNLERITYAKEFDGFPMFSADGKKLVWCSNRYDARPHETNVFIADWVD